MISIFSCFTSLFKRRLPEQQSTWLILLGIVSVTVYAFSRTDFPEIARIGSTIAILTGLWGLFKYGKITNSYVLLRFI
jgi:O-antigen ligase